MTRTSKGIRTQPKGPRADHPFALHEIDIESDDELHARYLERIPVIALDGEELFDFFVDEPELRRRLGTVGAE